MAKGVDAIALRIREVAKEHNVPIVENVPLARALYAAVDIASDKIDAQLRKYKERLKEGRKHVPETPEAMLDESKPSSVRFSVVKQVPLSPMTPDAAALEMERLGYTFWMFHNEETQKVNVIFRRLDDSFGLLQPVRKESH